MSLKRAWRVVMMAGVVCSAGLAASAAAAASTTVAWGTTTSAPAGTLARLFGVAASSSSDVLAVGGYNPGERLATIVGRGAVFGVQFHPEKSSASGLALLERFVALCATDWERTPIAMMGRP